MPVLKYLFLEKIVNLLIYYLDTYCKCYLLSYLVSFVILYSVIFGYHCTTLIRAYLLLHCVHRDSPTAVRADSGTYAGERRGNIIIYYVYNDIYI